MWACVSGGVCDAMEVPTVPHVNFTDFTWEVKASSRQYHQDQQKKSFLCFRWGRQAVRRLRGRFRPCPPLSSDTCHTHLGLTSAVVLHSLYICIADRVTYVVCVLLVARTTWCAATSTPCWLSCPWRCLNSSSGWPTSTFCSWWSCRSASTLTSVGL